MLLLRKDVTFNKVVKTDVGNKVYLSDDDNENIYLASDSVSHYLT